MPGRPPRWPSRPHPLAALVLGLGLFACREEDPTTFRDVVVDYSDRPLGELVAGVEVTQVFIANHDNLTAVALMMSNNGGRARDCEVVFRLRVKNSSTDLAERNIDCSAIPDQDWVRFDFPPLVVSRRWRFVISVQSPNARAGQAPLLLMASVSGIYPDGKLRLDDRVVPGALRFMTFHR